MYLDMYFTRFEHKSVEQYLEWHQQHLFVFFPALLTRDFVVKSQAFTPY